MPRASSAPILPDDEPPPPSKPKQRTADTAYPPTYSSSKPSLWNRFVKVFEGDEPKAASESNPMETSPQPRIAAVQPTGLNPVQTMAQPIRPASPSTVPPAWKWYGYGAPIPGSNALAPTGRYGIVQPSWYTQTGATPGAIPKVDFVQGPALPIPANEFVNQPSIERHEPILPPDGPNPASKTRQADIQIPVNLPTPETGRPASIEVPGKPQQLQGDPKFTPVLPVSWRNADRVSRAQAPEAPLIPSAVIAALKSTCAGHVTRIDVTPKGPRSIVLNLTIIPGILSDRLADRIARIPELNGWEVELQFAR